MRALQQLGGHALSRIGSGPAGSARSLSRCALAPDRLGLAAPTLGRQPLALLRGLPPAATMQAGQPLSTWDGSGSQQDYMLKDMCILVDDKDVVVGHASKHDAHRFVPEQPSGRLHRAFSVFLFDLQGRLLLQQRAASKVTFPSVWTNTCCSHPLHGQEPAELDTPADVASGAVPGVKRAAVRKLQHELGIPGHEVPLDRFRFLTRLHYCAPDSGTYGPGAEWGEHEMDYILFIQADVSLAPNPEEVDAVRYVTLRELRQMMAPESGLAWSPWFRIIAERFLSSWWADLPGALAGAHDDVGSIHKVM